jgi:phosphate transport system permease protein
MTAIRTRRNIADAAFVVFCWAATALALGFLALILFTLLAKGLGGINMDIFTKTQPAAGETGGGLLNAITGSIIMCALGMVFALIIGILAGTWLAEYAGDSAYGHAVRFVNDVLLSAPSILVGLFVYELLVQHTIGHYSGVAGAVALAFLAAPVVTRTTEDILRLQPQTLREAGVALGAPQWVTIRKIIWKSAGAGMLTGGLLAFARISGETAPLLFTSLGNVYNSVDLKHPIQTLKNLGQPMGSLPKVIYDFALSPDDNWRRLAWVGSLLIAFTVLSINIIGRVIAARGQNRS